MSPARHLALVTALAAGCAVVPATASATTYRNCGQVRDEGITPDLIKTRNVSCRSALRLARLVSKVPSYGGCYRQASTRPLVLTLTRPCNRNGFRCYLKARSGDTQFNVRCLKGATQVVRWRQR